MTSPEPPDLLARAWAAFRRALDGPARGGSRADLAGLAGIAAAALALAHAPVLVIEDLPLDLFVQLDGASRWAAGQRPHLDYFTPVGRLWYDLLGVAGSLSGNDPLLVLHANLLLLPLLLPGAWLATRDRLPDLPRVLLACFLVLLALSPRTLDSWLISGVATYNRYGWAFAGIAMAAVLLPPERVRPRWPEAAVVAIAMAVVFHLKVTYLGLVLGTLAVAVATVPATRGIALWGGAAGLALVGGSLLLPGGAAYLGDLARAADVSRDGGLLRPERLVPELRTNQLVLFLILGLGFWLARSRRTPEEEREATRVVLGALAVTGGLLAVTLQSHDKWIPLLVLPLTMVFGAFRARGRARGEATPLGTALSGAALCAVLAGDLGVEAQALARVPLPRDTVPLVDRDGPGRRIRIPSGARPDGTLEMLRRGEINGFAFDNLPRDWRLYNDVVLQDGLDLLVTHGLTGARVTSLTFCTPYPYLLGAPPPKHLPNWWDWKRTIGPPDAPRMSQILSDSDVVLLPKVWNIEGLPGIALPVLQAEFEVRDQTALWTLWVRRPRAAPRPLR